MRPREQDIKSTSKDQASRTPFFEGNHRAPVASQPGQSCAAASARRDRRGAALRSWHSGTGARRRGRTMSDPAPSRPLGKNTSRTTKSPSFAERPRVPVRLLTQRRPNAGRPEAPQWHCGISATGRPPGIESSAVYCWINRHPQGDGPQRWHCVCRSAARPHEAAMAPGHREIPLRHVGSWVGPADGRCGDSSKR